MRAISEQKLRISILDMSLKITNLKLHQHLPGANELIYWSCGLWQILWQVLLVLGSSVTRSVMWHIVGCQLGTLWLLCGACLLGRLLGAGSWPQGRAGEPGRTAQLRVPAHTWDGMAANSPYIQWEEIANLFLIWLLIQLSPGLAIELTQSEFWITWCHLTQSYAGGASVLTKWRWGIQLTVKFGDPAKLPVSWGFGWLTCEFGILLSYLWVLDSVNLPVSWWILLIYHWAWVTITVTHYSSRVTGGYVLSLNWELPIIGSLPITLGVTHNTGFTALQIFVHQLLTFRIVSGQHPIWGVGAE